MPSRTASWISICYHPILFGIGCFLLILYRFFPYLFSLLVESSPVIGFTLLLLGLLLIYGEQDDPIPAEEDDPGTEVLSSSEPESTISDHKPKRRDRKVDSNVVNRRTSKAAAVKETVLVDRFSDSASNVGGINSIVKVNNEIERVNRKIKRLINDSKPSVDRPADHSGHEIDKKKVSGFKTDMRERNTELLGYDSSVASSMHRVDHKNASSDSESDVRESSSSSGAEVLPMLDELDPLLDSGAPTTAQASKYNSDDDLSAYDRESNDGSTVEETENAEDEDDDEKQEEKDEGNKVVVKWTADDQRNLVDLAKSELERNRRLENLIAKRRQKKIMQHEMERNLIELEGNDSLPGLNGNGQLSSIIVSRMNPFDLPYDDEDIPGSAPSILHPRRNPFDSPFDSSDPSEFGTADNSNHHHQDFVAAAPREIIFRRHESFSVGFGDVKQDRRFSKFRPYFEVDTTDSDETGFSNMHELLREFSDLRANFAPSGLVPTNEENRAGILQDSESSSKQSEKSTYKASRSTGENEQLPAEREDTTTAQASDGVLPKQDHPRAEKAVVIDEEYGSGSSSSSTPEPDEMSSKLRAEERHTDHAEETTPGSSTGSNKEVNADSKLQNEELKQVHDNHIVNHVYDSSPKTLLNAPRPRQEKEDTTISDTQASASTGGLLPDITERSASSEGDKAAVDQVNWVAQPSLASVDKIESTSREITLIKEKDVLGVELSRVRGDYGVKFVPVLPESAERKSVSVETEGS